MTLIYWRILFFCLVPVGVFILVKGIKLILKSFNGAILLDLPFTQKSGVFSISEAGHFSVWHKGTLRRKAPLGKFRPRVYNQITQGEIQLNHSLMSPRVNGFSTGRMELFTFYAMAGNYILDLAEGSSVSGLQQLIGNIIPVKPIDLSQYFIQVRASQSQLLTLLAIPLILLGAAGIACGLVFGILADKFF